MKTDISKFLNYIGASFETSAVLLVCAIVLVYLIPQKQPTPPPGEDVPIQYTVKLKPEDPKPTYAHNPPSSGAYREAKIRGGMFTQPVADEQMLYLLHKGWVAIQYNCQYKTALPTKIPLEAPKQEAGGVEGGNVAQYTGSLPQNGGGRSPNDVLTTINEQNRLCGKTIEALRKIVDTKGSDQLIVYPNSKLDAHVAAVAWGKVEKQEIFQADLIDDFVDFYRGRKIQ